MSTEKEYDVVFSDVYKEFKDCVNYKINNGWELRGGVCVVVNPASRSGFVYYQAVTKEGD
jgi:Domain of unknown function (DUF1737)